MTEYTADDFKRAEFATRDASYSARHAMRCNEDSPTPWQGQYGAWSDDQMAGGGWVPVPAESYTRADEQPRPLTADDITDEMVRLGAQATTPAGVRYLRPHEVLEVLTAALTEPTRPEGAEDIEAAFETWEHAEYLNGGIDAGDKRALADHIAKEMNR